MKRLSVFLVSILMLVGCQSATDQAMKVIDDSVKKDETALVALSELTVKEETFLKLVDELLIQAEDDFAKASSMIPETLDVLTEMNNVLESQEKVLTLSETQEKELSQLAEGLEGEVSTLVTSFLSYKTYLTQYLALKLEVNHHYEAFLTSIKADMPFKEIEKMLASLNQALRTTTEVYQEYETSAYEFSANYELIKK